MVSVIIPVYNVKKYLEKSVGSVTSQTYKELEILLVDDGSTDGSGEICDKLADMDSRIAVVHKKNGGLSDARNVGLDIATGDYILFVDSDDTVNPELIERCVKTAEKYSADIVLFDFEAVDEDTGRRGLFHSDFPPHTRIAPERNKVLYTTAPCAWNKLYRAELWKKTGIRYPVGLHYEDLATSPRIIFNAKIIVFLDAPPMYYYLLRKGSIMRNDDYERSFKDRTAVLKLLKAFFESENVLGEYEEVLEFLVAEHGFFVPSKEILYSNPKSPYLLKFREYALGEYPSLNKNIYLETHSKRDRILFKQIYKGRYFLVRLLSAVRKILDK